MPAQIVTEDILSNPVPSRVVSPHPVCKHRVHTPLRPQVFARFLLHHPDYTFVSRLIQSLTHGFNIGYFGPHTPVTAKNLPSALEHADIVDEALRKELAENRMAGPYSSAPYTNIRCSGLGVVPKKDGTWRLIYHLSAPIGNSINDYIDPLEFSLQYSTVDDAIAICHRLGKGALWPR